MKAWLAAATKVVVEFLILLVFFSAAAAFSATIGAPSLGSLASEILREALRVFPWALAIAIGLGLILFGKGGNRGVSAFLSVFLLGMLIVLCGVAARNLLSFPDRDRSPSPVVGQALESGDRLVSIAALEGVVARRVIAIDFAASFPRLHWAESVALDGTGTFKIGEVSFSLARPPLMTRGIELPFIGTFPIPLERSRENGILSEVAAALAFILLVAGLATPALALRSPLTSFCYLMVAVAAAIALEYWLAEPGLREILGKDIAALGLGMGIEWITVGLEAFLGIAGAAIGLILARRVAS